MRLAMIGLALAVLALAPRPVLAQKPPPWADLRCAEMPLAFDGLSRCQVRSPGQPRGVAQGQAIEYLARGGPAGAAANAREVILWLLWFRDDWVYQPYAPELAENIIRAHIQPSLTGGATRWSALQSFGTTNFLTFDIKGKRCVGFDHGGPLGKPATADAAGHPWLLRGIVCERRANAFEPAEVEAILRGVRLSKGGQVDAFGNRWGEAAAVEPASPPPVAAAAAADASRQVQAVPLALAWEDVVELASGSFSFAEDGRSGGTITFVAPETAVRCNGFFKQLAGGPGTTDHPSGTWAVSCPGGDAASGTWRAETPASGRGQGQDLLGRRVTIRFGG